MTSTGRIVRALTLFSAVTLCAANLFAAIVIPSSNSLPAGAVSAPYSAALTATGGTSPYKWSITSCSGSCNTGLNWSTNGTLFGTPANTGTSTFGFKVTDASGNSAIKSLSLTIGSSIPSSTPAATPLSVSTTSLPTGTVSKPYSAALAATGGTSPYAWAITSCSGPCNTGLGWSTAGTLSGTPTNAGTSIFSFKVTDAAGNSAAAAFNVIMSASGTTTPPVAASVSITPASASVTASKTQQFSATVSGATNTAVTWKVNNVTGGNATAGTISSAGLYTAPASVPSGGSATVTAVSVSDSTKSASATVSIAAVAAPSSPPAPTAPSTADYYVSPSGSNSNPCTQASPCATLDYAFNSKATAGQTVQAAPGTYSYGSSAFYLSSSGTAGKYKTLTCASRGACKITNSVTGNATVIMLSGNYVTLDGFEVTNSGPSNNFGLFVTGSNVQITRNTIHHIETDCSDMGGGGIQLNNGVANILMDSNLIYDISWSTCNGKSSVVQTDGILAETVGQGVQITNNIVYHVAGGWGILYGNSSGNSGSAVISNNTVFSNSNGGIAVVNGGDYSTISNNIVLNNGATAQYCGIWTIYAADSHILIANNDVYGNTGGDYCAAGSPVMSNNISVNPALGTTFVNWQADGSGNYHEQSGSPTRSTATASCASGSPAYLTPGVCSPTHDYDGNPRSTGTGDIGAFQYQ